MQIHRHHADLPAAARGSVVAIGNFDGLHLGHQAVIARAAALAEATAAPLGVVTFEPHPYRFFKPDAPAFRLTSFRGKATALQAMGVNHLYVLPFDAELARTSAESFARDILGAALGVRHVVAGSDFVFGHKRGGDMPQLTRWGAEAGFSVTSVAPVTAPDGARYSSSAIRQLLAAGDIARANALLGRPWEIEGHVLHGDKRGRQWGFPTLNLALGEHARPAYGVYACRVGLPAAAGETAWHDAVCSIGQRATVDGATELLEAYVFDFDREVYGQVARVALIAPVRLGDTAFESVDALQRQIQKDCDDARAVLARQHGAAGQG